jgi:Mn-dependent DtxR family transcriptional regulator
MSEFASTAPQSPEYERISFELIAYVFESLPSTGVVPLAQICEDLEESPETILEVMDELQEDGKIDFTSKNGVITITRKDKEFLQNYSTYITIRR